MLVDRDGLENESHCLAASGPHPVPTLYLVAGRSVNQIRLRKPGQCNGLGDGM